MRRPVKPFVTEYRGGARRAGPQGPSLKTDAFKEPELRAADAWPAPPPIVPYAASQQQEDSYEAALRAADSLFAGVRHPVSEPQDDSQPFGDDSSAAHPSGGRVLRAVDEPPSHEMQEMLRLEAEFAPKKRGRKPGSKNKPKVAALADDWASPPTAVASEAPAMQAPAFTPVAANEPVFAEMVATKTLVRRAPAPKAVVALTPEAEPLGPRGERYAWVRTRLKPGQQWKRRLPKVAW